MNDFTLKRLKMTYRGHISLGYAFTFSPVLIPQIRDKIDYLFTPTNFILAIITIYFFSLFADLDEPKAYLSKTFPWNFISIPLSSFVKHRGITHTFIFSFVFPLIFSIILYSNHLLDKYGFLIFISWMAYVSHLIGDSLTKGGVKWLYPISSKNYRLVPKFLAFRTGSFIEDIITVLLLGVIGVELYYIIPNIQLKF